MDIKASRGWCKPVIEIKRKRIPETARVRRSR